MSGDNAKASWIALKPLYMKKKGDIKWWWKRYHDLEARRQWWAWYYLNNLYWAEKEYQWRIESMMRKSVSPIIDVGQRKEEEHENI